MNISQKGVDLIKGFEGLRLKAYKVLETEEHFTIGYGHYGSDVKEGEKITQKQAEDLLKKDIKKFVDGVNKLVKAEVNQNQFDALVSFAYNVGLGAFGNSTLLEKLNKKDYNGASREFYRWNKSDGKVLKGLTTRRDKEQELFDKPVPKTPEKKPPEKSKDSVVKSATKKTYKPYTIQLGDTLSEIAEKFGVSLEEIASINRIDNIHKIYAGNKIKIPNK